MLGQRALAVEEPAAGHSPQDSSEVQQCSSDTQPPPPDLQQHQQEHHQQEHHQQEHHQQEHQKQEHQKQEHQKQEHQKQEHQKQEHQKQEHQKQEHQKQEHQGARPHKRTRLDPVEPAQPSPPPPAPHGAVVTAAEAVPAAAGGVTVRIDFSNRAPVSARTGAGTGAGPPATTRPPCEAAEVIDLVSSSSSESQGEQGGRRAGLDVADDAVSPGPGHGPPAATGVRRSAGRCADAGDRGAPGVPGTQRLQPPPRPQLAATAAEASPLLPPPPPPQQHQQNHNSTREGQPAPAVQQQQHQQQLHQDLQRPLQQADPPAPQFLHPLLFQLSQFQTVGADMLAALASFTIEWVRTAPQPVLPALMQMPTHAGRAAATAGRGGGGRGGGRGRGAEESARVSTLEQLQVWLDRHSAWNAGVHAASPGGAAVLDLRGGTVRAVGQGPHRLRVSGSSGSGKNDRNDNNYSNYSNSNDGRCDSGGGAGGGGGGARGDGDATGSPLPALLICNGTILGCTTFTVEGGADIAFLDVSFTTPTAAQRSTAAGGVARHGGGAASAAATAAAQQQPHQWDALVVVRGEGSRARLKNCRIDMEVAAPKTAGQPKDRNDGAAAPLPAGPSSSAAAAAAAGPTGSGGGGGGVALTASRTGCVLAIQGGCVELSGRCELIGGSCFGLAAVGAGAVARAELATSYRAGTMGFLAAWGGKLVAVKCSAEGRGGEAAAAAAAVAAAGNVLVTHTRVVLHESGFAAVDGGSLTTEQCVARRCGYAGFLSWGLAAELASTGGCRAEENGLAGFLSGQTAVLRAGPKCRAEANKQYGFRTERGGTTTAAEGAAAARNGGAGWVGLDGAVVVLGRGCRALENGDCGFLALKNAVMVAGEGCVAQGNSNDGWRADESAQLVAAAGCRAIGNGRRGFAADGRAHHNAVGGGSSGGGGGGSARLVAGRHCVADSNRFEGFAAEQYGSVVLFPGCGATGNGLDGFYVSSGGRLDAGCGGGSCQARDNGQHGFGAEDPGSVLVAGPGCSAVGNGGWGAMVVGKGACMRLGASDWQAEGNAGGAAGQDGGGRLEWVQ